MCRDLDILVAPTEVRRATELLEARGYALTADPAVVTRWPLAAQYHHELRRADGTLVELHWAFSPRGAPFPLDPRTIWNHLHHMHFGTQRVLALSPEDLLLLMAAHGMRHGWARLGWVCDIAQLLRSDAIDWDLVLREAEERRVARVVRLALFVAWEILNAPLSAPISNWVRRDKEIPVLGRAVRRELIRQEGRDGNAVRCLWLQLRGSESISARLRVAFASLVVPKRPDVASIRFPKSLSLLYYLVRPLRLAIKYAGRTLFGFGQTDLSEASCTNLSSPL